MRTTLKIDEDVLKAARQMAGDESVGVGKVVSRLARSGLESGPAVGPRRRPSRAMPRVLAAIFSGAAGGASMSGIGFVVLQLLLVPFAVVVIVRIAAGLSPF